MTRARLVASALGLTLGMGLYHWWSAAVGFVPAAKALDRAGFIAVNLWALVVALLVDWKDAAK